MLHPDGCLLDFFLKVLDRKFIWHYRYGLKYGKKKNCRIIIARISYPIVEYDDSTITQIPRESEQEDFTTTKILRKTEYEDFYVKALSLTYDIGRESDWIHFLTVHRKKSKQQWQPITKVGKEVE